MKTLNTLAKLTFICSISIFFIGCEGVNPKELPGKIANHLPKSFKMDVEQGNKLSNEAIAKVKTGMTVEQVNFLLGTPLLKNCSD